MSILLLGAFLLLTAPQTAAVNFFSPKQDLEIGTESAEEAEKVLPLVRDANLNLYLKVIADRLTRTGSLSRLRYRLRIVNSKEVNSLGFPGGAIYINRSLLEVASNDDEVAAMIAHEIGHVASRHGTAQLSRQLLVQAPASIAAGLPTMDGWKEQLTKLGISFGVDASFLRYSRDQELEASLMAVRLLTGARFHPQALLALLEKVNDTFVFNHPQSDSLRKEIAAEIEEIAPSAKRARASADFRTFHSTLQKMAYPAPGKGAVENEPAEAISETFTHPLEFYRLGYPAGWQITRTGPNGAIIAPVEGVQASRAGNDVTHGVIFDLFDLSTSEKQLTLEQATNRLIVFLRQPEWNQSLRMVPGAQANILISDEPGLRTVMIGTNSTRSSEVVWVVTRLYYKTLFYMVCVAPEDEFPAYQPVFEQMIRSIRLR